MLLSKSVLLTRGFLSVSVWPHDSWCLGLPRSVLSKRGGVIGWVDHILLRSSTSGVEEGVVWSRRVWVFFYYEGD